MLNGIFRLSDYIQYLISSTNRHGVHSPFVYSFNERIINGKERPAQFEIIENTRRKMIRSKTEIDFEDFGSGNHSGKRRLSQIAANTARSAKYGKFLYRLLASFQPQFAIELGTGSGITALYQGAALSPLRPLHTIEGSTKLSEIARYNAEQCGLSQNIIFHTGPFDHVLPLLLQQLPHVDYAFVDGNHSYEPTMRYFEMLLAKAHDNTVLVFDDIYWSEEMKRAWAAIKQHPDVTVTIDIFAFGIVFFRKGQEKEHFMIRY